ncbi:MAG: hypothetical protein C0467_30060 [Planctomycetaceae bacterium]|nr:hypothetical protein [Planctomycetaceae bacterium]
MSLKKESEADIQRACLQWLNLWGATAVRVNSAAMKIGDRYFSANNQPGCSDILACLPDGAFAAIEVKKSGGRLAAKQRSFLDAVVARNGLGLVVHSLTELQQMLQLEGYDTEIRA